MSFKEYDSKHNLISSKLETQSEITEHKKNAKRSKRSQEILSQNVIETNKSNKFFQIVSEIDKALAQVPTKPSFITDDE